MEPKLGRFPIEVFGHSYHDTSDLAAAHRSSQYCPFIGRECTKPRKSEPQIKVGICTLGYRGSFLDHFEPVIVCPCRFLEATVFSSIQEKFFPEWEHVRWVKEVNMGVSGNVDYVALKTDAAGTQALDFFCVEFQACGTTGSPYPFVRELLDTGHYKGHYTYGMNWANEFMKTMMQQVYKKGQVVTSWKRKLVFVIQDVALQYLESAVDTSDLRQDMADPIHFMTYKLVWREAGSRYVLRPSRWVSTDLLGINRILAGANAELYLTEADFLNNAVKKGLEDGVMHG